ncbi:MAG: hypothetical protein K6F48_04965 [Paludibacteraceae bacterium]|nr:hypothetical protein [Paludibacteraceae bacterium]
MTDSEFKIKEFSLSFGKYDACDIPFTAKIGSQTIKSYLSNWSVNFDLLRHQLEGLTFYPHNGNININFEDDPTEFIFKQHGVNAKMSDGSIKHSDILHLQILPNCFTKTNTIEGFCEPLQVISAIYEAFLQLGRSFATCKEFDFNDWRYSCGLNIYNTLKSGIVETFLKANCPKPEIIKRQTVVNHIITICAGKDICGYLEDGSPICLIGNANDLVHISGFETFKISGIKEWVNNKKQPNFDFEKWNQQGLNFAKQIRSILSEDYDVWYESSNKKSSLIL